MTPVGMSVHIYDVYKNWPLEIYGLTLTVDLLLFELGEFELILLMDGLGKHIAVIGCHNK